jgi:hypothetical protein
MSPTEQQTRPRRHATAFWVAVAIFGLSALVLRKVDVRQSRGAAAAALVAGPGVGSAHDVWCASHPAKCAALREDDGSSATMTDDLAVVTPPPSPAVIAVALTTHPTPFRPVDTPHPTPVKMTHKPTPIPHTPKPTGTAAAYVLRLLEKVTRELHGRKMHCAVNFAYCGRASCTRHIQGDDDDADDGDDDQQVGTVDDGDDDDDASAQGDVSSVDSAHFGRGSQRGGASRAGAPAGGSSSSGQRGSKNYGATGVEIASCACQPVKASATIYAEIDWSDDALTSFLAQSETFMNIVNTYLAGVATYNNRTETLAYDNMTDSVCKALDDRQFFAHMNADRISLPSPPWDRVHPEVEVERVSCDRQLAIAVCSGAPCYDDLTSSGPLNVRARSSRRVAPSRFASRRSASLRSRCRYSHGPVASRRLFCAVYSASSMLRRLVASSSRPVSSRLAVSRSCLVALNGRPGGGTRRRRRARAAGAWASRARGGTDLLCAPAALLTRTPTPCSPPPPRPTPRALAALGVSAGCRYR